jgi:hypothetical protein
VEKKSQYEEFKSMLGSNASVTDRKKLSSAKSHNIFTVQMNQQIDPS